MDLPAGPLDGEEADRVFGRLDFDGPCWLWLGCTDDNGYGVLKVQGKFYKAHCLVWRLMVGEVPVGLQLDHLCRVHACCNPDHLEPVTSAENSRRGALIKDIKRRATARRANLGRIAA